METIWTIGANRNIFFQSLGGWLEIPMRFFTFLGTEHFFLFLLPALYWNIDAGVGLRVGVILLICTNFNDAFKLAFHGPRPYWYSTNVKAYATETSFGAPSGHAQIATGVWGMLAAQPRKWWAWLTDSGADHPVDRPLAPVPGRAFPTRCAARLAVRWHCLMADAAFLGPAGGLA